MGGGGEFVNWEGGWGVNRSGGGGGKQECVWGGGTGYNLKKYTKNYKNENYEIIKIICG